ncbi:hypothetical protein [Amnibacterium sp.]|uniref:hypothetical protein n=1 Tax=Amnibacterium sp. TaxID=1872496 RepID=UPI003F7BEDD9
MAAADVELLPRLPASFGPERLIRFFPDYAAAHPLWFAVGHPPLADLRLPDGLAARLRRWSDYWVDTFGWDTGWPDGAPAQWWSAEEDRLPRDVSLAFGREFVVEAGDRYLHSTTGATSPSSAEALGALLRADAEERARVSADLESGARYDVDAAGLGYRQWLAERGRHESGG